MTDHAADSGGEVRRIDRVLEALKLDPIGGTVADVVATLEQKYEARFKREAISRTLVRVALEMANGDRICGQGVDTEAAVVHLVHRLDTWPAAEVPATGGR